MVTTCFVVMAIGEQQRSSDGESVTEDDLREHYNTVIKEALTKASPDLEVTRADEVSRQGTITTDILTRLMHSDYVVVDITYPNPNVYYELGVRHACTTGTVIIREKDAAGNTPFDVSHQRYIEYESTPKGVQELATEFERRFESYDENPSQPDNHLLEHAKNSKFNFPQYGEEVKLRREKGVEELVEAVVGSEALFEALFTGLKESLKAQSNVPPIAVSMVEQLRDLRQEPETVKKLISGLTKLGIIDLDNLRFRGR